LCSRAAPQLLGTIAYTASVVTWAMIFMLVLLKIPIVYLCGVIWWAIRAEPKPGPPLAPVVAGLPDLDGPRWDLRTRRRSHSRGVRPPRGPARRIAPRGAAARARP